MQKNLSHKIFIPYLFYILLMPLHNHIKQIRVVIARLATEIATTEAEDSAPLWAGPLQIYRKHEKSGS